MQALSVVGLVIIVIDFISLQSIISFEASAISYLKINLRC